MNRQTLGVKRVQKLRSAIDHAARAPLKFAGRVDTERCGEPAALDVIVGGGYGYARPDGVAVIPVGALGV